MMPDSHQLSKPKACVLLLTLECTLRCKMCSLWQNKESGIIRPTLQEWMALIASLGESYGPRFNVIFGGGEPLLFSDMLTELISLCHKEGLRTSLATSGYLIDERMARRLIYSKLDYIALTLYSLKEETQNFLRGVNDSYQRLLQAITHLDNLGSRLEIAIDTVIMRPNIKELLGLTHMALQDKRIHSIFFQAVVQPFHTNPKEEWFKAEEYKFLWPDDIGEVDALIDDLIKLKINIPEGRRDKINNSISQLKLFKSYFKSPQDFIKKHYCNVIGGDSFTVSPDGSVNLCPYMKPIGNIRENDINEILRCQQARERRQEISLCRKNCHHIVNCWYEEETL